MEDTFAGDDGWSRSRWNREQAGEIERRPGNVAPVSGPPEVDPFPDLHVWDTWLLRDRHGEVAEVDGWRLAFSLTADADLPPGTRHDVAEIRCFCSRDGVTWRDAGPAFDATRLDSASGLVPRCTTPGAVLYYTRPAATRRRIEYTQRIAVGHGGTVVEAEGGIALDGP
jgi:Levansucrase/Invertase.